MKVPVIDNVNDFPNCQQIKYASEYFKEQGETLISSLTIEKIIKAYQSGLFPFYDSEELSYVFEGYELNNSEKGKTVYCSPYQRYVLDPKQLIKKLKESKNLRKSIKHFQIQKNTDFEKIILGCKDMKRNEEGEWMTTQFIDNYLQLHELGYAQSYGAYREGQLAGGIFGIRIGNIYSGDSMFRNTKELGEKLTSNSSKAAIFGLAQEIEQIPNSLIDCQYQSDFFETLGGFHLPKSQFGKLLEKNNK